MKRALLLASLALVLAAPALAQRGPEGDGRGGHGARGEGRGPGRLPYANPSAGIAADIERARLTGGKKGRWFALRQTAAPDAVMFVPQMVLAQPWLKARGDMKPGYKLRPFSAWASCDGSLIVTSGASRDGASDGWYTTVWQRQPDGAYRWVFDHGGPASPPLADPEMIEARVAECPATRPKEPPPDPRSAAKPAATLPAPFDPASRKGSSRDGSLIWQVTAEPDGSHRFIAGLLTKGQMEPIRDEKVGPGGSHELPASNPASTAK